MKLTKDVFGVVAGEVYPKIIAAGEDCPVELEDAARDADALEIDIDEPVKTKKAAG